MTAQVSFVKGHCGWDTVTLVPEGQIPPEQELACALKIVSAPIDGGLEVGFLGFGKHPYELSLRMVSSTARDWIAMCGGMTQVIGKALIETFLRGHFGIDATKPRLSFDLQTLSGRIPIGIETEGGKVVGVTTMMDRYLDHAYERGIEPMRLLDVPLLRVGEYAVLDLMDLEAAHPALDFTQRDFGPALDIVHQILRAFADHMGTKGVVGMMFDERPEGPGHFRVFPRFYSEDLAAARLPWEFQCGTGSIAVAIALATHDRLPSQAAEGDVIFEWGSYAATPDPYGIRTSRLQLEMNEARLTKAAFSHSVIEILAEGRLTLPGYQQEQGPP
jgi:hypothetical protein